MKIGMNLLLWTGHVTTEHFPVIEAIKKAGADGVEVPIFEGDEKHYQTIGKELKRLGLGVTCVACVGPEANPISPDAGVRKAALARLKWVLNNAAAAGAEILAGPVHSAIGVFSGNGPTEDEKKWAAEVMYAAAEEAKKVKIRIACEYLNRFEIYLLTTAADSAAFVKRVNHPNFRMMFDTFHANIEEKDPVKAFLDAAPQTIHYHISENDRGTPGTGHVPWAAHFKALRKVNYDGWLTIEAFGRALPELAAATRVWRDFFPNREEVYVEGIKFIRRMWESAAK
jgi:D-psicose/D-tagatose/L-ribulose 3-epimerase